MQRIHLLAMFIPIQLPPFQVAKTGPWWSYSLFFSQRLTEFIVLEDRTIANKVKTNLSHFLSSIQPFFFFFFFNWPIIPGDQAIGIFI